MKMNFFFGNVFWGILLILWGASLILRNFNIYFPLAKIFFAVVIILFGIKLLVGSKLTLFSCSKTRPQSYSGIRSSDATEHTLVFANSVIDLTDLATDSDDLEITAVFASAVVYLPSHISVRVHPTSVFGQNILPKERLTEDSAQNPINIESTAVFGKIVYIVKDTATRADIVPEPEAGDLHGDF